MISSGRVCVARPTAASRSASRFFSALARVTARSAASGARRSAAPYRRTWRWKFAKSCRIAMSTSTTWTSVRSACTRPSTTGSSQEEFKVKYIKARIAEVTSDGEKLIVKGEDTLVKRPITIPFDMVVHAIGMDPNVENPAISETFGVDLEEHGFIDVANRYGAMGETSRPGYLRCWCGDGSGDDRRFDRAGACRGMAVLSSAEDRSRRRPGRTRWHPVPH